MIIGTEAHPQWGVWGVAGKLSRSLYKLTSKIDHNGVLSQLLDKNLLFLFTTELGVFFNFCSTVCFGVLPT
jgi:hypothetical protein